MGGASEHTGNSPATNPIAAVMMAQRIPLERAAAEWRPRRCPSRVSPVGRRHTRPQPRLPGAAYIFLHPVY